MRNRMLRWLTAMLALAMVATTTATAQQAQGNAVITGKVTGDGDLPLEFANVYINELNISVPTNAQGVYTMTIPAARALGQAVNLRVRAISHTPGVVAIRLT